MDHSEFFKLLDSYSQLSETEISELEAHAAVCETCRNELDFFKSINETVSSLKSPPPPADLADRINSAIDEFPKPGLIRAAVGNIKANIRQYATAAACLVIGIVVGANSVMIEQRLSGSDDGVIKTSTVTESDGENSSTAAVPTQISETVEQTDTQPEVSITTGDTAAPMPSAVPARTQAPPSAPAVPNTSPRTGYTQPRTETVPTEQAAVSAVPSVPVQTAQPESSAETVSAAPVQTETVSAPERTAAASAETESYTIAQDRYHMPNEHETAAVTQHTENEVDSYSLAQDTGTEYSYADASSSRKPDRIAVYAADSDKFMEIMGRFSVESSDTANIMSSGDFFTLLAALDAEGINYSYITRGGSDEYVSFIVVLL